MKNSTITMAVIALLLVSSGCLRTVARVMDDSEQTKQSDSESETTESKKETQ